jgi:hypothetical protein
VGVAAVEPHVATRAKTHALSSAIEAGGGGAPGSDPGEEAVAIVGSDPGRLRRGGRPGGAASESPDLRQRRPLAPTQRPPLHSGMATSRQAPEMAPAGCKAVDAFSWG